MRVLRTPQDRLPGLPGLAYDPRYVNVGGLWMSYVETGPADGEPVLLLHGEPSWSFLYRTVMPVLAGAGFRAIAPDLIGLIPFGIGGTSPSGGLSGVTSGTGIGITAFVFGSWIISSGSW